MNTTEHGAPRFVKDGLGRMIVDRRSRPRVPANSRVPAAMNSIRLAILDARPSLDRDARGCDPYDNRQGRTSVDIWGRKRRD